MTARRARRRGEPLAALLAIVAGWVGARAVLWQSPFPELLPPVLADRGGAPAVAPDPVVAAMWPSLVQDPAGSYLPGTASTGALRGVRPGLPGQAPPGRWLAAADYASPAGHQWLWLAAAERRLPSQPGWAEAVQAAATPEGVPWGAPATARRKQGHWSGDAWLFLRGSGTSARPASFVLPSYGASQAGAVLRYRFAPGSGHDPFAYLRAVRALGGTGEAELATGFGARPLPWLPLTAQVELRADPTASGGRLRPAALAVVAPPATDLPFGLQAQAYLQAGYVGGHQPTAFADGAAKIDREVARFDLADASPRLRVGAGMWGGAQRGAARLDVGPSGSLDVTLGKVPARLSLDLRQRVAGDARPGSGVALTISTGF